MNKVNRPDLVYELYSKPDTPNIVQPQRLRFDCLLGQVRTAFDVLSKYRPSNKGEGHVVMSSMQVFFLARLVVLVA